MTGRTGWNSIPLFVAICAVILSMYGGGFATIPAYLRDMFGTMQVGAIHGRLLTAWSVAGVLGPGAGQLHSRIPEEPWRTAGRCILNRSVCDGWTADGGIGRKCIGKSQ